MIRAVFRAYRSNPGSNLSPVSPSPFHCISSMPGREMVMSDSDGEPELSQTAASDMPSSSRKSAQPRACHLCQQQARQLVKGRGGYFFDENCHSGLRSYCRVAKKRDVQRNMAMLDSNPAELFAMIAPFCNPETRRAAVRDQRVQVDDVQDVYTDQAEQSKWFLVAKTKYKKMRGDLSSASSGEMSEDFRAQLDEMSEEEYDEKDRPAIWYMPHLTKSDTKGMRSATRTTSFGPSKGGRRDRSTSRPRRRRDTSPESRRDSARRERKRSRSAGARSRASGGEPSRRRLSEKSAGAATPPPPANSALSFLSQRDAMKEQVKKNKKILKEQQQA